MRRQESTAERVPDAADFRGPTAVIETGELTPVVTAEVPGAPAHADPVSRETVPERDGGDFHDVGLVPESDPLSEIGMEPDSALADVVEGHDPCMSDAGDEAVSSPGGVDGDNPPLARPTAVDRSVLSDPIALPTTSRQTPAAASRQALPESPDGQPDEHGDAVEVERVAPVVVTPPTPSSTSSGSERRSRPDAGSAAVKPAGTTPMTRAARAHRRRQTRIITIANQKGGVGKTTTAVNLAAALAMDGHRVVVIDTDPQGNASTALGIMHQGDVPSVYDVLVNDMTLADVAQPCPDVPGLTCIPATIDLAGAEIELVSYVARETRLQRAVQAFLATTDGPPPDYILIDCPPSLGLLTLNAFVAGEEVLIPIQCEYYALEGLSMLLKNIEMIRRHLNPRLHISTILLTMYDARTRLSSQVAEEVRTHFPEQVLRSAVPRSVRISEAPSHGLTVMTYDPTSSGALSYLDAARELVAQAAPKEERR